MAHSGFRRDPQALNTEAVEDYAKALHALAQRCDGPVSTSALAERLGVSAGSVTSMLKRMDEMGLVRHEPYRGALLTERGERVALEVIRHHRLLESYLAEVLGMPWDRVHDEAEVLEHYISEELEERIASALGDPASRSARRSDPERTARPGRRRHGAPDGARAGRRRLVRARLRLGPRDAPLPRRARDQAGLRARGRRAETRSRGRST